PELPAELVERAVQCLTEGFDVDIDDGHVLFDDLHGRIHLVLRRLGHLGPDGLHLFLQDGAVVLAHALPQRIVDVPGANVTDVVRGHEVVLDLVQAVLHNSRGPALLSVQIGRASCRERGWGAVGGVYTYNT